MNLSNDGEFTVRELAERVIRLTGTSSRITYRPLPQDDPKVRQPDITRAKNLLGWEPKVSRAEGLKQTYSYFKSLPPEDLHRTAHRFA